MFQIAPLTKIRVPGKESQSMLPDSINLLDRL
jgi:hypothetical protein